MTKQIVDRIVFLALLSLAMGQNLKFTQSNEFVRSYSNGDEDNKINGAEFHRSLRQSRIYARQNPAAAALISNNGDYLRDNVLPTSFTDRSGNDNNYDSEENIICTRYRQSTQIDNALPKTVYRTHCFVKSPFYSKKRTYSVNRNFDPVLGTIQEQWSL